jgi:hypothetical protein
MCRKELGGAAKYRDGRRPSCCGELREAVIVHFADGGLSFSCWETRVLDKKRRYWKLAGSLGWFVAKSRIWLAGGNAGGQRGARLSRCDARSAMGDRRS